MISLQDLKTAFRGYSYFYGFAPIGTKLPYIEAHSTGSDNFTADSKVYSKKFEFELNCYFARKNESAEEGIENILDSLDLIWEKSETYDDDQTFYLITYSFWR